MLDQFRAELIRQGFSQNTVEAYTRNARLFTDWVQATTGEPFDNQISVFDGREYRGYLLNIKKLSPNSINAKLQAVQCFADFLASQGTQEPVKLGRQKVVAGTEVKVLDKATLYKCRRWAAAHASLRDAAIFELLLNTGLRESELAALTLADIQITERKGSLLVRNGKGGKSRTVPLNSDARAALQRYIAVRPINSGDRVFYGQRGPLQRSAVYRVVNQIGRRGAGVENLSPHVLRHTMGTRLAKAGVELTTIAALMGHSDPKTTARFYIATTAEDRERAVDALVGDV